MSTFLELAQKLRQNTVDSGTGPLTVVGNTGESARFCSWIADAWSELQTDRDDWRWMHKYFTLSATASDGSYAYTDALDSVSGSAISRFANWDREGFKAYLTSAGVGAEYPLYWLEWPRFRRLYRYGTQTDGPPIHVSVDETMALVLGPVPNATYTVSGGYRIGPQTLAADEDEPEMPARFHSLIMYEAMQKYGGSRVAPEAMVRAVAEGSRLRAALEREQLPPITWGDSLA